MPWLTLSSPETPEGRVALAQLRLSLRSSLILLPEPALAVVAYFLLRDDGEPAFMRLWAALVLGVSLIRAMLWTYMRNRSEDPRALRLWGYLHFLLCGLGGVFWGALGAAIGLIAAPLAKLVVAMLVMGLAAGNSVAQAAHPPATFAFLVPALTPLAVALARQKEVEGSALAIFLILFMALIGGLSRVFHSWLVERLKAEDRQNRLVETLAEAKTGAEEIARQRSRFLADMSHEFRTPLNAILGFSDVLREPKRQLSEDKRREYAADIHHAAEGLLEFVNDVLDLARSEAGRFELSMRSLPVRELVAAGLRMVAGVALPKGVRLDNLVEDGLELWGDDRAARHCLVNLLSNAVKFTPSGGHIKVEAVRRPDGGIDLSVEDDGIGIAPADQARLFTPFEQVKRSDGGPKGTGLGLALTRSLMEAQGGAVSLISARGKGARFTLHFPPKI